MAFSKIKKSSLDFGDEIGVGGYSVVYKATWKQSFFRRKEVAAKVLHRYQPTEVEIMSKLDHQNIVKLLGVVEEKPDFYLIMEFCSGGSLREYLNKRHGKRLSEKQLLDWMKQSALPIQYLKKMGVVHKDIKSPNYLIVDGSVLKLTDFGISKELEATMSNATESASVQWMAPELMKDSTLSPTYDIFAYGVVVWELCTTQAPYKGLESQVVIMRVCRDNQRLEIPADLPQWIINLMTQCWDNDWKYRPSMDQVIVWIDEAEAAAAPPAPAATAAATKVARQRQILDGTWEFERTIGKDDTDKLELPQIDESEVEAEAAAAKAARQRQILDGLWMFERKIGEDGPGNLVWPSGIAVSPYEGTIAIADTKQVQLYSRGLAHVRSLDTQQGLDPGTQSKPREVAFGSDGTCYVTISTPYVLTYGVDGAYNGKWPAVSPQHKSSDTADTALRGVTTDSSGQVLLGEIKKKYISKHKPAGQHVASIKVDIAPYSLAMTSQDDIIISDLEGSVHIVDNADQLLRIIKSPSHMNRWNPAGVACYDDIICVCNEGADRVHCYSVSGEYLRDIPISIPGRPRHLAFTAQLIVLSTTGYFSYGKVVVYKLQE